MKETSHCATNNVAEAMREFEFTDHIATPEVAPEQPTRTPTTRAGPTNSESMVGSNSFIEPSFKCSKQDGLPQLVLPG